MRFTAFILSILVLVLSCLPCADADSMTICKADTHKEIKKQSKQQEDNNDTDLCSPFCHCACCATFSVINKDVIIPQRIEIPVSSSFMEFLSAEIIEISLPVWQPPQLV